ncbi:MAG: VWA domain-containing protein [Planctomycetota bacterium]
MSSLLLAWLLLAAPDSFADQKRAYERGMKRPPLGRRAGVIDRFARTRDPRALDLLAQRYRKPRVPKEHERYLLASAMGRFFGNPKHAPALAKLLRKHAKDEHAWLWYQIGARSGLPWIEQRSPFLRAAVFEASGALASVSPTLERDASSLMVESAARVLWRHQDQLGTDAFETAGRAVIAQLALETTPPHTRLAVARTLASIFRVDRVTTEARYWRRLLAFEAVKEDQGPTRVAAPRFFGVEATGQRIVFLIDLSDSMLEPITPRERMDVDRLPRGAEGDDGVDWSKVKTRFDLAKFFLGRYLEALPKEVRFAVIGFGDAAVPLKSGRSLQKAQRGSVRAAMRDIEKIKPFGRDKQHPHGQLRGGTNIHGALRQAFRLTTKRALGEPAFVQGAGRAQGADTIFLLSDGNPTKDDYEAPDAFAGGQVRVNRETGETAQRAAGSALYNGPYVQTRYLREDARRMNLFRKAEIHTIGLGSASETLMRGLSEDSLGRFMSVGARAPDGRLRNWWVIGPFPVGKPDAWTTALPPEGKPFDRRASFSRKRWQPMRAGGRNAVLNLSGAPGGALAYARFRPDHAGKARLSVGAEGGVRVWLNGKQVIDALAPEKFKRDRIVVDVELVDGENTLLVRTCSQVRRWRLQARIDGTPVRSYP